MKLITLSIISLFLASCAALTKVAENKVLVGEGVRVAATIYLDSHPDKKALVLKISDTLDKIPVTHKLTSDEVLALVDALPGTLPQTIVKYYEKATKNLKDEDVINTIAVLSSISDALKLAAD